MRTQLLCTFSNTRALTKTVDLVVETYDVLYNKVFVLKNVNDTRELMCTYNVEASSDITILENTISLHRKKNTNTLYTINALNRLIESVNNGVLDTTFQVDWENYRNCMLLTNDAGLKRVDTEVHEIIYIKVKR
tara:strand:+ start:6284 stop:6685 length:402 start_codon:yes stop_codon:yes gene_type:complete